MIGLYNWIISKTSIGTAKYYPSNRVAILVGSKLTTNALYAL